MIHKKMHEPYIDWSMSENRQGWESGVDLPVEDWINKQEEKYISQREDRKV